MLLEVFLGGAEVDILNEDGPFVRVVSPRRCSRGTAGFMLIYKVVKGHGIVPSSLACSYSSSGLVYRFLEASRNLHGREEACRCYLIAFSVY